MIYRQARFLTSAAQLSQCPPDQGYEVAFAGRSNAGKSSAINALCDHRGLAKTSKTPGRTRLINFFSLDEQRRLVDLPGYGYAKVSGGMQKHWQKHLADYLAQRRCLQGLVLLMDCRHPLKAFDRNMIAWAENQQLPVHILLTKADKLGKNTARQQLQQVKKQMPQCSVQLFSAPKKQGLDELYRVLDHWLNLT